ncbi:multidrug DMT transporter permease [Caballeronia fortuita]|uniref:Multidrug DMT transporter permease n=1 Tax=Caballeronia fortuita TaxID=1777138 RepID=A0A158B8J3_9BURK|nr:EamA family transporter [Caballeronia fortuita]SAK66425.1 multidrug DMT transporter permease [Caballeronia fortuita]
MSALPPPRLPFSFPDRFPFRPPRSFKGRVALALTVVYLVWGSTYLGIHLALDSFPPLMLGGLRNLIAGIGLFAIAVHRKSAWPSAREVRNAAIVGTLLEGLSSGMMAYGMRTVGTGTAAVMVATVPLFATIFTALSGRGVAKGEWFAVALGLIGIVLLNHGDPSPSSTVGTLAILCAAIFWAGGAHLATRLPQPSDLLMSTALQIGLGGFIATAIAFASGERLTHVGIGAGVSFVYLVVIGSMAAYVAYNFLIRNTSTIVATSCLYVNPVVAVGLGALLLGEIITQWTVIATVVILLSVGLSFWFDYRRRGLA